MSKASRYNALMRIGFLPSEAKQLSVISKAGSRAPYIQKLLKSRQALYLNSKRYEWSQEKYRSEVRKVYEKNGAMRRDSLGRNILDVWQLVRRFEDKQPVSGTEYTSPWAKRISKKSLIKKTSRVNSRLVATRLWIKELTRKIDNPKYSEAVKSRMMGERARLEKSAAELEKMQEYYD